MQILQKRYRKDPNIVSRKIADEVILVTIKRNVADLESIYTLNEVSTRIWELIDGQKTLLQIRDIIVDEFEANPNEVESDLKQFLQKLEGIGGVQIA
ncbi:MAG: PqqD family protein [Candidatus Omnitrophota bacterium]|nr:MAG: PqqD family protein [Candidatus Omnitrophota bacterium]